MYVYLVFPKLQDFADYICAKRITLVGLVERYKIKSPPEDSEQGYSIRRQYYRLTAKDYENEEIVVCEIDFYEDIWTGTKEQIEEVTKLSQETKTKILKKISPSLTPQIVDAEFMLEVF